MQCYFGILREEVVCVAKNQFIQVPNLLQRIFLGDM